MVPDGHEKYRIELRSATVDMSKPPIKTVEKGVSLAVARYAWEKLAKDVLQTFRDWFFK